MNSEAVALEEVPPRLQAFRHDLVVCDNDICLTSQQHLGRSSNCNRGVVPLRVERDDSLIARTLDRVARLSPNLQLMP